MSKTEMLPCFCGAPVDFHHDDGCDGCHYIECKACKGLFDFSMAVDPDNKIEELAELQTKIAAHWNGRRTPASESAVRAAALAVVRNALDDVSVHPCDVHNDDIRATRLGDDMRTLYDALKTTPTTDEVPYD